MNAVGLDGMKALADIFKKFPLLERLDMNSAYIREDEVSVLCKSLVSLKKLKYLNLSGNCVDIEILDDVLGLPATLEELLLSDVIHGKKLFVEMKQLQNMRKLHLNKLILKRSDVEALVIMLSCFPKLEELSLSHMDVPECAKILTAIKWIKNIRKIDLTGIKLSNEEALVDMLSFLSSLEELALTDMRGTNMDYERLFSAMKLLKRLKKLSLGGVRVFYSTKAFFEMISFLSTLEDIVFPVLSFADVDSVAACFKALKSLEYLRSLDLRSTEIFKSTIGALACELPSLKLLEKLRLNFDLSIEYDESERDLFAAFGKLKNLKVLITDVYLDSENALAEVLPSLQLLEKVDLDIFGRFCRNKLLLDAIGKLRYLKEFSYRGTIENTDIEAFAHALTSLPLLEKLSFGFGDISNDNYVGLYAAFSKLKYLKRLDLDISNTAINSGAEALAEVLPSLELLEELTLQWGTFNRLDSEHEKQVLAAIRKLRYLKKLDYGSPVCCSAVVKAFGEMLTSLQLLEKLELHDGLLSLSESDVKELFIAVGKLKYLKELNLGCGIKITQTNAEALVRALPSLRMLEKLKLKPIYDINESKGKELFISLEKLKYLKKFTLDLRRTAQTKVDAFFKALASLPVLEELTLRVKFCFSHECDDNCADKCDHQCSYQCYHNCELKCGDKCGHDSYDDSCDKCRHDKNKRLMDLTKKKVRTVVEKLKYFRKFSLNAEQVMGGKLKVT